MKSVRLVAPGEFQVLDEPIPTPLDHEKLVRVKSVGICGSDLHWYFEGQIGDAKLDHPLVLGHEFAGETETGQRVAVDPALPCGHCEFCRRGHPNLCPSIIFFGHGAHDGALREWIAIDARNLVPLPDALTFGEGAMLEALGVALHAVDLGKLRTGMTVGVFGCGSIGLLIIQLARLSGASTIIAADLLHHRAAAAEACGADAALLAAAGAEIDRFMDLTLGRGVDVSFEVAGEQAAVDASIAAAVPGGRVVLVGIPANDQTSFQASTARRKGLTILLTRRMKHTYPRAIDLVSKGLVDVRSLITHRFPLDQAGQAFQVAGKREGIKVCLDC